MPIGLTGNDFWPLRAQSLYDPNQLNAQAQNAPDVPPVIQAQSVQPPMSVTDRFNQMYQPQTQISDAYKQALMNVPQQQPAGKLRTIAAVLAGLGAGVQPAGYVGGSAVGFRGDPLKAAETADYIKNEPYYNQLGNYERKTKALGAGAAIEERQNTERARTAETTLLRQQQQDTEKERERANQAREGLNQEKSDQIYETKLIKLNQDLDIANQKSEQAMAVLSQRADNQKAQLDLRQAQLDALNARHQLDVAQKDKQLDEMKKLHGTMQEKWNSEAKDREARIKLLEEQIKGKMQPVDTTTTNKDATGKVTGTKETVRALGGQQKLQKEIPGIPGSLAESTDGGKTWKRIK